VTTLYRRSPFRLDGAGNRSKGVAIRPYPPSLNDWIIANQTHALIDSQGGTSRKRHKQRGKFTEFCADVAPKRVRAAGRFQCDLGKSGWARQKTRSAPFAANIPPARTDRFANAGISIA